MLIDRIVFARASAHRNLLEIAHGALRLAALALQVRRERRQLAALDDRMLKDIGLSRSLIEAEFSREFLDLPRDRLRREGF